MNMDQQLEWLPKPTLSQYVNDLGTIVGFFGMSVA